jgi:hypothetical protein
MLHQMLVVFLFIVIIHHKYLHDVYLDSQHLIIVLILENLQYYPRRLPFLDHFIYQYQNHNFCFVYTLNYAGVP